MTRQFLADLASTIAAALAIGLTVVALYHMFEAGNTDETYSFEFTDATCECTCTAVED